MNHNHSNSKGRSKQVETPVAVDGQITTIGLALHYLGLQRQRWNRTLQASIHST